MQGDFYSLVFFGFYLDSDEEELSQYKDLKELLDENDEFSSSSESSSTDSQSESIEAEQNKIGEKIGNALKDVVDKTQKHWILDVKKQFRLKRNQRNFFKIMLLFFLQMMLLFILLWVISIQPSMSDDPDEGSDWPYLVLVCKFICSVILHVTL